jgi:hypothetical protein
MAELGLDSSFVLLPDESMPESKRVVINLDEKDAESKE